MTSSLIQKMDFFVAQTLHDFFSQSSAAAFGAIVLNYAGVIALGLLVALFVYKKRNALTLVFFLLVPSVAYLVSRVGKFIWERPRPFVTLNFESLINTSAASLSFPSSHATVAFALATALYHYHKKSGRWAFGIAALVAMSRLFVGVHFITDVLAGALLGVVTSYLMVKLWKIWSS